MEPIVDEHNELVKCPPSEVKGNTFASETNKQDNPNEMFDKFLLFMTRNFNS